MAERPGHGREQQVVPRHGRRVAGIMHYVRGMLDEVVDLRNVELTGIRADAPRQLHIPEHRREGDGGIEKKGQRRHDPRRWTRPHISLTTLASPLQADALWAEEAVS